jgi:hypothetical protein
VQQHEAARIMRMISISVMVFIGIAAWKALDMIKLLCGTETAIWIALIVIVVVLCILDSTNYG